MRTDMSQRMEGRAVRTVTTIDVVSPGDRPAQGRSRFGLTRPDLPGGGTDRPSNAEARSAFTPCRVEVALARLLPSVAGRPAGVWPSRIRVNRRTPLAFRDAL
jgi:hypothetical protein